MTTNKYTTAAKNAYSKAVEDLDDSPVSMIFALIVLAVLLSLLLKVIALNIAPFLIIMGDKMPAPSRIPIFGWAWDLINILTVGTGAFFVWSLINLGELAWIFIALDRAAHRAAIRASQAEQAYHNSTTTPKNEDRQTRKMRKRATKIPFFFIAASGWIALACFVVDAIVNWRAYPIVKDFSEFTTGLSIGDLSMVDWNNLLIQAWNLFSLELLVVAIIICTQWVLMHKSGSNPNP